MQLAQSLLLMAAVLWPRIGSANTSNRLVQAKASEVVAHEYRIADTDYYRVNLSPRLVFTNQSQTTVLLYKELSAYGARIAVTQEDLRNRKYVSSWLGELFVTDEHVKELILDDFILLGSGKKFETTATQELRGTTITQPGSNYLSKGKYWIQFAILATPQAFYLSSQKRREFQAKWKSRGRLVLDDVWTEPFEVEVKLDPKDESCP
jgi:hypothetical protein